MNIQLFAPLERAFDRMVASLFRPFDLARWCVVGFSCWLARLLSGSPSFGGAGGGNSADGASAEGVENLAALPLAVGAIGCVVLFALVVIVAFVWLSSRGQFLFLDNVVTARAAIAEPWRAYARQADSLFLWRIGFGLVLILALGLAFAPALVIAAPWQGEASELAVPVIALTVVAVVGLILVSLVVRLLLIDFVVPLMYRYRLTAIEGWRRLLPLLRAQPAAFALYALLVVGLYVGLGMAIVVVGLATCCLGFLVLIIPYVGTVLLLPVYYTFRAFSLEFLAQLGPEFDVRTTAPAPH